MARGSRSRSTTKGLLICGFAATALYVVGDIVSGFAYRAARPYSFKDQWISELTATGSPVRAGAGDRGHDPRPVADRLRDWRLAGGG
jgi:hypothetical protein